MLTQPAILERVIESNRGALGPDLAKFILKLDFPPDDHARYHELSAKARDGTLTADEQIELDNYLGVNTFLTIMQSKARVSLRDFGLTP